MSIENNIKQWFDKSTEYILLFSGGFDSSCLLAVAKKNNVKITPVWINNGFNRASQKDIEIQAQLLGVDNLKIKNTIPQNTVKQNSNQRCYYCKNNLIDGIFDNTKEIIDGTNFNDLSEYRPGIKALKQRNIKSPLAELKISKEITKKIALQNGASDDIAQKESCIATRINYDIEITQKRIDIIRNIENEIIDKTQDYNVRCRVDDEEHIRIELSSGKSFLAFSEKAFKSKILKKGEELTTFVCLDLKNSRPNEHDKKIK